MTDKQIEEESIKYFGKYSADFILGAKWMQEKIGHEVCDANEAGELLAYNCEKRARQEVMERADKCVRRYLVDDLQFGGVKFRDILYKAMKGEEV